MSFVRVCRNVNVQGDLVAPENVDSFIRSQPDYKLHPWFMGVYTYPEDALEYFKEHGNSMKGYQGGAFTHKLHWDLDDRENLEQVRSDAVNLIFFLEENYGVADGIEIHFSGNKGFHITLETTTTFTPEQVKRITARIAREAEANTTYDPSVYDSQRIFRYPNTLHQASGLWKIPIAPAELVQLEITDILKLAENQRGWESLKALPSVPVDVDELVEKYDQVEEIVVDVPEQDYTTQQAMSQYTGDGPFERQCIKVLQEGGFGPGEREHALIRMAAYYKNCHLTEEQVYEKLNEALEARSQKYEDLNPYSDYDTRKVVKQVFDPAWRGGMYSCKTDTFLIEKCSNGGACCMAPKKPKALQNDMQFGISGLIKNYVQHGDEAVLDFPKTGLSNLDRIIKLRRQNISIIAGAPGSGKTSLVLEMMDALNKQKIYHVFFSLDMAAPSLFEMLAIRYTNYTVAQVEAAFSAKTRDIGLMQEIAARLTERLPYSFFDISSAVDLKHVEATVKKTNEKIDSPVQVCFIDYAGRLMGTGDSTFQKATANALMANDIAKVTNTHMMFIAQTSRESGDHTTPLHSNRVSKDSSEWEANATVVLSVWRPFGNGIDAEDKYMHIYTGKNRTGPSKELYFNWNGNRRKIWPMSSEELTAYSDLCQQFNKPLPSKFEIDQAQAESKAYQARTQPQALATEAQGQSSEEIRSATKENLSADTPNPPQELPTNNGSSLPSFMHPKNTKRS